MKRIKFRASPYDLSGTRKEIDAARNVRYRVRAYASPYDLSAMSCVLRQTRQEKRRKWMKSPYDLS